jgi:hypothetical protein
MAPQTSSHKFLISPKMQNQQIVLGLLYIQIHIINLSEVCTWENIYFQNFQNKVLQKPHHF